MSRKWWNPLPLVKTPSPRERRAPGRRPATRRPRLEALEERLAPAQLEWTGSTSSAWNVAANWHVLGTATQQAPNPSGGDELFFPAAASNKTGQTIGFSSLRVEKINYTGSGYSVCM